MMEKQIEEMAQLMCEDCAASGTHCPTELCDDVVQQAQVLYNAGYRKQSEGEWIRYPHNSGIYCSLCKHKRRYRDIRDAYCPNCGAQMKGGES